MGRVGRLVAVASFEGVAEGAGRGVLVARGAEVGSGVDCRGVIIRNVAEGTIVEVTDV